MGSRARLNSCGAQALLLRGMWDLPGSVIEPASPALAGRFFTTEPPGSPSIIVIITIFLKLLTSMRISTEIASWSSTA